MTSEMIFDRDISGRYAYLITAAADHMHPMPSTRQLQGQTTRNLVSTSIPRSVKREFVRQDKLHSMTGCV
jgi:hypothetical protein